MIRPLLRTALRNFRPFALTPSIPVTTLQFCFAKQSKKEQVTAEKKKEKNKVKQSLGGDVTEIDLNKYEEKYTEVIQAFKDQISTIRVGRLDPTSINQANIKIGSQLFPMSAVAQVSAKSANVCVVSPFDSSQIDIIQKSLKIWNDALEIKKQDNALFLTQLAQGKDAKTKLAQRVKKLSNDRREQLKRLRSATQDELKKYKKVVPQDRMKVIEEEAKSLFDKNNKEIDKLEKQKEKQLMK